MILFRYVLKEYFKYVVSTVLLCVFLFILFDFIHKTTGYFARYQPSASLIAQFYLFQLPFQLVQILPIASLLASVSVMVIFNRSNEMTAMRAAGMSPRDLAAPLFSGGLALTLFAAVIGELIVPYSAKKMHEITEVQIEGADAQGFNSQVHWVRDGDRIFFFETFDSKSQTLYQVKLVKVGEPFYPRVTVQAESARYLPQEKQWLLEGVQTLSFNPVGQVQDTSRAASLTLDLPLEPHKLKIDRRLPDELSLADLHERIAAGLRHGIDTLDLRIAWHVKLAYPLAALLISLLGLPFAYRSERTTETVKSVLLAFTMGISYWFILSAAKALASSGDLAPFAAGWLANGVIALIVSWQFWRLYRI